MFHRAMRHEISTIIDEQDIPRARVALDKTQSEDRS